MHKKSRIVSTCVFLVGLVPLFSVAQDAARIEQVVQEYVANKQFMGSVLVARGDQIVFDKGYGFAYLEWQIPNTPTTKYRIGSITKQFTAASILLLEERGKLSTDDLIKKFMPDAPAAWDAITLKHLLTHTSGIPNLTADESFQRRKQFGATVEETIKTFRDKPLDFAPGVNMRYSNSGYLVLGFVVEKASGQPYAQFLQQNIFTPLGMKDSGYDSNADIIEHRAMGYVSSAGGFKNADFVHMSIPHGAGGLYSTAEDLLRWERGLYGNKVLQPASLKKMTTPFKENYAFGIMVNASAKRPHYTHGGSIEGFNAELIYYPESQTTIAVLANVNGRAPGEIMSKLGPLAHGETITLSSERREIALPRATLQTYVGTYSIAPNVNLMISLEGEQLFSQMSGQRKLPLFAEAETRFFTKAVDAQIEFVSEGAKISGVVLQQNGREIKGARTADTVLVRKEITVPVATLQRYVGTYELRPGFDLVIKVENDALILHPTGQGTDRLYAETESKFFSKVVDATIEFDRDASGNSTSLTLNQGAFKGNAKKKQ